MGSNRKSDKVSFDDTRKPSHGRISGPTRRSTRGQWSPEEDAALSIAVQRFQGKNWKKIAECFKDRTDVQCLHRWQKVLNPDLVKGPWSKEEDSLIIELVKKYGAKKWSTIAQHLPGRIGKQCRERWHNHLNPDIIKEAWTQNEELLLIGAHRIYGNKWAELTKFLPGRSDNAIKNHWNSSVKKKLGMYLASGLLSQFELSPLIIHQDHSAASTSSKAQPSDDIRVKFEEVSDYSQDAGVICLPQSTDPTTIMHPGDSCHNLCSDLEEATIHIPEEQSEAGDKFFEHDLSMYQTFSWADLQGDLPSSGGSSKVIPLPAESCVALSSYLVNRSGSCPRESAPDADGHMDKLLNNSSEVASQSCYLPPDVLENSVSHSDAKASLAFNKRHPDQFLYSSQGNAEASLTFSARDDFIYSKESYSSPPKDECYKMKNLPRLVPANDFVLLPPSNDAPCSPSKEADIKTDEQEAGPLCYEPPRFPSLEIPFLSCDLQYGSDMHQDYSPFGIRQLMMSSMTPFNSCDSPSKDDIPEAVLRSSAKTLFRTPSILKKRHRDLVSPLSEKRDEKKLEGSKQEPISSLTNDFSKLNMMFCECVSKEGTFPVSPKNRNLEAYCVEKENTQPSCLPTEDESCKNLVISECNISSKQLKGIEFLDKTTNETAVVDLRNPDKTAKDLAGTLAEHDINNPMDDANVPLPSSSTCKGTTISNLYIDTPLKRSLESPSAWKSPWFLNTFVPGPKMDTDIITLEDISYFLTGECSYDAIGLMNELGEQTAATFSDARELFNEKDKVERRILDFGECGSLDGVRR